MRKGAQTRQHIIVKSAALFNQKGYAGSSMQDIMHTTGLTKGGIYRRFAGKDDIAVEAFDYACRLLEEKFKLAAAKAGTAIDKVMAICSVHSDPVHHPPLEGGCPLLNTAVECDDGDPVLREKALGSLQDFLVLIERVLQHGIAEGEFRSDMNTESVATMVVASLEGGVMASRLARDNKHIGYVLEQIRQLLAAYSIQ